MKITLKEWLYIYKDEDIKPEIVCGDGFVISMQGSKFHHCYPKVSNIWEYRSLEVRCRNYIEPVLSLYSVDARITLDTIYPNVPTTVLENIIEKHGGIYVSSDEYYQVL